MGYFSIGSQSQRKEQIGKLEVRIKFKSNAKAEQYGNETLVESVEERKADKIWQWGTSSKFGVL